MAKETRLDSGMEGYHYASKIDEQVDKLLVEDPPNETNIRKWMIFARTLQTTIDLLNRKLDSIR